VIVLIATIAAVIGMMQLKDYVNRSEAVRAMNQLGQRILDYRNRHGSLPPQSFVDGIKEQVEGSVRIGNVKYRAIWIGLDAPGDTILAYSPKRFPSSFLHDGYVVLHLDGKVEWLPTAQFAALFTPQQTAIEPRIPTE
jgi:type II secretory pathway pseudopilin PulG